MSPFVNNHRHVPVCIRELNNLSATKLRKKLLKKLFSIICLILEPVWTIGDEAEGEDATRHHLPVVAVDVGLAEKHLDPHLCPFPDWHLSSVIDLLH
jgi:hypothetical protein